MKQIQMPVETPVTLEIFGIPNLTTILPEPNIQNSQNKGKTLKLYTESIMNLNTENTMIIFTDGSALSNPGPVGAGVVIKNKAPKSTPVKLAKAVKQMDTSYEGEIEAIKLAVEYANENITSAHDNLHIFSDSQAAILSITSQDSEKYHNRMIRQIRENIMDMSEKVDDIKIIYCPAHIGIEGNELADGLAKTGAKKAKHLQPDPKITLPQLKQSNKGLSIKKWSRRWSNSFQYKYKYSAKYHLTKLSKKINPSEKYLQERYHKNYKAKNRALHVERAQKQN